MATTAQLAPSYNRYGRNGWNVFAVGFCTMWFRTAKEATIWAKG